MTPTTPRTLFDKLWDAHVVTPESDSAPAVLYIDLHLIHEVTTPQAFAELDVRGLPVRRPERTKGTLDHSTPTLPPDEDGHRPYVNAEARAQVEKLRENCARFGVELFDYDSPQRGIVHVMGPELGLTQPGQTQVASDWPTWVAEKYRDIDLTGLRDWDGDAADGGRDDGVAAEGERLRRQLHRDGESTPGS